MFLKFLCRLELKGSNHVLGEFLEFKGKQEDIQALRNIKRSKVGRVIIQKTSMLGLGNSLVLIHFLLSEYDRFLDYFCLNENIMTKATLNMPYT